MRTIQFDNRLNAKTTVEAARKALSRVFEYTQAPSSLLDVGCGPGAWLRAASEMGVRDVCGIDGVDLPASELMIDKAHFKHIDLETNWSLGRKFDLVLCLEVAEHLSEVAARILIQALTVHTDVVCFSAACPWQGGQHHVNLQWPAYWQRLFNEFGFRCEDTIRWAIWQDSAILPWFRQNMFLAIKDPDRAGHESHIQPVLHPTMLDEYGLATGESKQILENIERGSQKLGWYFFTPVRAVLAKISRVVLSHRN